MNPIQLHLTAEERAFLADLLERTLQNRRVEEHRTRAPAYRENILRDEALISSVLQKLGATTHHDNPAHALPERVSG